MEEMDEGRVKAMASASANAKPNKELTTKPREEGELSSSDDDVFFLSKSLIFCFRFLILIFIQPISPCTLFFFGFFLLFLITCLLFT